MLEAWWSLRGTWEAMQLVWRLLSAREERGSLVVRACDFEGCEREVSTRAIQLVPRRFRADFGHLICACALHRQWSYQVARTLWRLHFLRRAVLGNPDVALALVRAHLRRQAR